MGHKVEKNFDIILKNQKQKMRSAQDHSTVYVEFCQACDTHSWCTHHDEAKYIWYFKKIANMITQEFPEINVVGNKAPSYLTPITGHDNKFYNTKTKKSINFPAIGAFEIVFCGQVLFSKKKTNTWPELEDLRNKIKFIKSNGTKKNIEDSKNESMEASDQENNADDIGTDKQTITFITNEYQDNDDVRTTFYKPKQAKSFTLTDHFKIYKMQKKENNLKNGQKEDLSSKPQSKLQTRSKKWQQISLKNPLTNFLKQRAYMNEEKGKREMIIDLHSIEEEVIAQQNCASKRQRGMTKNNKENRQVMKQWDQQLNFLEHKFRKVESSLSKIKQKNKQFDNSIESEWLNRITQQRENVQNKDSPIMYTCIRHSSHSPEDSKVLRALNPIQIPSKYNKIDKYINSSQAEKNKKLYEIYGEWKIIKKDLHQPEPKYWVGKKKQYTFESDSDDEIKNGRKKRKTQRKQRSNDHDQKQQNRFDSDHDSQFPNIDNKKKKFTQTMRQNYKFGGQRIALQAINAEKLTGKSGRQTPSGFRMNDRKITNKLPNWNSDAIRFADGTRNNLLGQQSKQDDIESIKTSLKKNRFYITERQQNKSPLQRQSSSKDLFRRSTNSLNKKMGIDLNKNEKKNIRQDQSQKREAEVTSIKTKKKGKAAALDKVFKRTGQKKQKQRPVRQKDHQARIKQFKQQKLKLQENQDKYKLKYRGSLQNQQTQQKQEEKDKVEVYFKGQFSEEEDEDQSVGENEKYEKIQERSEQNEANQQQQEQFDHQQLVNQDETNEQQQSQLNFNDKQSIKKPTKNLKQGKLAKISKDNLKMNEKSIRNSPTKNLSNTNANKNKELVPKIQNNMGPIKKLNKKKNNQKSQKLAQTDNKAQIQDTKMDNNQKLTVKEGDVKQNDETKNANNNENKDRKDLKSKRKMENSERKMNKGQNQVSKNIVAKNNKVHSEPLDSKSRKDNNQLLKKLKEKRAQKNVIHLESENQNFNEFQLQNKKQDGELKPIQKQNQSDSKKNQEEDGGELQNNRAIKQKIDEKQQRKNILQQQNKNQSVSNVSKIQENDLNKNDDQIANNRNKQGIQQPGKQMIIKDKIDPVQQNNGMQDCEQITKLNHISRDQQRSKLKGQIRQKQKKDQSKILNQESCHKIEKNQHQLQKNQQLEQDNLKNRQYLDQNKQKSQIIVQQSKGIDNQQIENEKKDNIQQQVQDIQHNEPNETKDKDKDKIKDKEIQILKQKEQFDKTNEQKRILNNSQEKQNIEKYEQQCNDNDTRQHKSNLNLSQEKSNQQQHTHHRKQTSEPNNSKQKQKQIQHSIEQKNLKVQCIQWSAVYSNHIFLLQKYKQNDQMVFELAKQKDNVEAQQKIQQNQKQRNDLQQKTQRNVLEQVELTVKKDSDIQNNTLQNKNLPKDKERSIQQNNNKEIQLQKSQKTMEKTQQNKLDDKIQNEQNQQQEVLKQLIDEAKFLKQQIKTNDKQKIQHQNKLLSHQNLQGQTMIKNQEYDFSKVQNFDQMIWSTSVQNQQYYLLSEFQKDAYNYQQKCKHEQLKNQHKTDQGETEFISNYLFKIDTQKMWSAQKEGQVFNIKQIEEANLKQIKTQKAQNNEMAIRQWTAYKEDDFYLKSKNQYGSEKTIKKVVDHKNDQIKQSKQNKFQEHQIKQSNQKQKPVQDLSKDKSNIIQQCVSEQFQRLAMMIMNRIDYQANAGKTVTKHKKQLFKQLICQQSQKNSDEILSINTKIERNGEIQKENIDENKNIQNNVLNKQKRKSSKNIQKPQSNFDQQHSEQPSQSHKTAISTINQQNIKEKETIQKEVKKFQQESIQNQQNYKNVQDIKDSITNDQNKKEEDAIGNINQVKQEVYRQESLQKSKVLQISQSKQQDNIKGQTNQKGEQSTDFLQLPKQDKTQENKIQDKSEISKPDDKKQQLKEKIEQLKKSQQNQNNNCQSITSIKSIDQQDRPLAQKMRNRNPQINLQKYYQEQRVDRQSHISKQSSFIKKGSSTISLSNQQKEKSQVIQVYFQASKRRQNLQNLISEPVKVSIGTQKNDTSDYGLQTGCQQQQPEVYVEKLQNVADYQQTKRLSNKKQQQKDTVEQSNYLMMTQPYQPILINLHNQKSKEFHQVQKSSKLKQLRPQKDLSSKQIESQFDQKQSQKLGSTKSISQIKERRNSKKNIRHLKQTENNQYQNSSIKQKPKMKKVKRNDENDKDIIEDRQIKKVKKQKVDMGSVQQQEIKIKTKNYKQQIKPKNQKLNKSKQDQQAQKQNEKKAKKNKQNRISEIQPMSSQELSIKENSEIQLKSNSEIRPSFQSQVHETKQRSDDTRALIINQLYGTENDKQKSKFLDSQRIRKSLMNIDNGMIDAAAKLKPLRKICKYTNLFNEDSLGLNQIQNFLQLTNLKKALNIISSIDQNLIMRLFQKCQKNYYGVWLCDHFSWKCFVLDQMVPVNKKDLPFYSSFKQNTIKHIWYLVLQKSLALYSGNYQNLQNLQLSQILHVLTGANILSYKIREDPQKNTKLISSIKKCLQKHYYIFCQKHDFSSKQKQHEPIYQIQNITKTQNNEVVIQLKQIIKQKSNIYWLKLEKFVQQFKSVVIVLFKQNSNNCRVELQNQKGNLSVLCLEFEEDAEGTITVANKMKSGYIRVYLYREEVSNTLKLVGEAKQKDKNQLFFDCSFTTGKYYIFIQPQHPQSVVTYTGQSTPRMYLKEQIKSQNYKNNFTEYLPIAGKESQRSKIKRLQSKDSQMFKNKKAPLQQIDIQILKQTFVKFITATTNKNVEMEKESQKYN